MNIANLNEEIQDLPVGPGVYLMKDSAGTVIYVGKAKNLRNRVRTYFGKPGDGRPSLRFLVPKVCHVETFLTDTEKEALILENTLIKRHRPRHNINLKDDKTYFSLKFSINEDFPKLSLVRKVRRDGARYFGPYASSTAVKETLRLLRNSFPLRTCKDSGFRHRSRPCLNYQIKKCPAPCCGLISAEKYAELGQEVLLFLEGKSSQLVKLLRERMAGAAEELRFEEAGRIRDQISAVQETLEKQKAVSHAFTDQDVFAFHRRGPSWGFQVLFFRRGLLVGNICFHFSRIHLPEAEALSAFLGQYYSGEPSLPREVLLPLKIEDEALLSEWLSEKRGRKVEVLSPERGEKKKLVDMARKNAEYAFQKKVGEEENLDLLLQELKEKLRLIRPPRRVECFDISNLHGTLAVGSKVSFLDGRPDRSQYRHFKVHAPSFPDDYAMMYEILKRRYSRLNGEDAPDLLVVDGGKGQLNVALGVLSELGLRDLSAVGIAKDKGPTLKRIADKTADKIYLPNVKDPILLGHSACLQYLQRIRDEAHRFAVSYHKKIRGKQGLQTILEEIPGIGAVKRKALLREFGSMEKIREASADTLGRVAPLNCRDARRVYEFFHQIQDCGLKDTTEEFGIRMRNAG